VDPKVISRPASVTSLSLAMQAYLIGYLTSSHLSKNKEIANDYFQ
jgi:hypothetical protein